MMKEQIRALLPRKIKPHRILAGPLRGAWLVTSWHDYPAGLTGRTERPLLEWFARNVRAGETWLDVGAHFGYTAFALGRLVGPSGHVFAFEPVPSSAGCVDQGRLLNHLPHVTVVPFGLGAPESFDIRQLALTRGMADATRPTDGAMTATPVARFDWIWPMIAGGDSPIHGIKIDVQGMEIETLEGMRGALRRWRPRLVVELHPGVSRDDVLALLAGAGYSRDAVPIEPARGEDAPLFLDDRSYAFSPA